MVIVYTLLISFLRIGFRVAGIFNKKARDFVQGREKVFENLESSFKDNKSRVVWMHCASLGEFEQGRPLIESLRREFPEVKILLTFFSPSGFKVRKNYDQAHFVCYLPWDSSANAEKLVRLVRPTLAIFVKYEYWYHYTAELKKNSIPILSISSIFRKDQLFFKSYGGFYRRILQNFSHFFVQNQLSLDLLHSIGIKQSTLAGDTRFDRVYQIVKQAEELPIARKFKNDQKTFVLGSCWPEDMEVMTPFINSHEIKFIIAPHEISERFISEIEKALQVKSIRFSNANEKPLDDYQVLIIDNIGMLSRLYRYGEFAFVGGGFGKGLHNILEAACYGIPIFFGNKNYSKFQEAVDLINRGGAFEINNYDELKTKYETLNEPESFLLACDVTKHYVTENLGATEKIMAYSRSILK